MLVSTNAATQRPDLAVWHNDAVIVPPYKGRFVDGRFALAVLDADGNVVPGSKANLQRKTNIGFKPAPEHYESDLDTLDGKWLYAGFFQPHFGHQITQCLGRLPWQSRSGEIDGVLYAGLPRGSILSKRRTYFNDLLTTMGVDVPFKVVVKPTRVEELFVGKSMFGEPTGCVPAQRFVHWSRKVLKPHMAPVVPGSKLYVSRNRLSASLGRILCENVLEDNLRNAGFQIFYPEEHSLADQFRTYSQTETIVTTDGSALHVVAFTQSEQQRVVVLARRKQEQFFLQNHLKGFMSGSLSFVDCIVREWKSASEPNTRVRGEIDFDALRQRLAGLGVLSADDLQHWQAPTETQMAEFKTFACAKDTPLEVVG